MINLQDLNTFEKMSDIDAIQVKGGETAPPPPPPFPFPFPPPVSPNSANAFIRGFFGSFNSLVGLFAPPPAPPAP